MEKEKFKLCDDLQSIFKDAVELTKRYGYKEISYETIFYCILKRYVENKEGKDEVLNDLFTNYEEKDKEKILKISKELMEDNFTSFSNPLPSTYSTAKFRLNPIISSQMNDVLIRAKKECDEFFGTDTIQTSNFYLSLMKENDQIIEYMAEIADMSCEELVKLLFKKSTDPKVVEEDDRETIGGELKEKIIDNPNAVEGDDKENKQPTPEEMAKMDKDDEEFEEAGKVFENAGFNEEEINRDPNSKTPYLDKYADNMIEEAKKGLYDPTIGRDDIIEQMIEVLSCRKKSNLILISDEGVGKDQCVQELARKIASGNVPKIMKNKMIFSLNFNKLLINSSLRGQVETRIQGIVDEACKDRNIIIYLPEIHNIIGLNSNGGGGAGDIANVLKPYLTGKISIIGSTTIKEFNTIEKDGAFKRRFQIIALTEPNIDETIKIIKGIKNKYSEFHHVKYSDKVIELGVRLADRYISERFFPDKAVDVLDMSGALASLKNKNSDEPDELLEARKELSKLIDGKIKAVRNQEFDKAAEFKNKEKDIRKKIENFQKIEDKKENNPKNWNDVTEEDVLKVISKQSSVPIDKLEQSDSEKIRIMKSEMEKHVIGQQNAINSITLALQRNIIGLRDEKKPIAAIYLCGASSLGKTLCVKELAKYFFGSEKSLIRFDMGEFTQDHEVSKLISTTAGYIGYDDVPMFDQIRRKPYSVVLFDEVEKAAKSINNIFLNILSEGYITLGNGTKVDFKNTIIIFTSNLGSDMLDQRGDGLGFSKMTALDKEIDNKSIVMKAMKKHFKPEFINRLTDIVIFKDFTKEDYEKIFDLEFKKIADRMKKKNLKLTVSKSIKEKIVSESKNGRDLEKGLIKYVENEICNSMVNDSIELSTISGVNVDFKDNKTIVTYKKKTTKTKESQPVE